MKLLPDTQAFRLLDLNQPRTDLTLPVLRLFTIRHIDTTADVAQELSVGAISRDAVIENPAIHAVVAPTPVLHSEVLTRFEGGKILPDTMLPILGVNAVRPAISQFLFQRATGKIQPWFVNKSAQRVCACNPD